MGKWRQPNTGVQRYQRIASAVPVRVSTVDPEIDPTTGNAFFRSAEETTANLSQGGAYLQSWEPLDAGRRVVVTIPTAGSEELQLSGRVVWTRRNIRPAESEKIEAPGYGVEFDDVSRREAARLDELITSLGDSRQNTAAAKPSTPGPQA